MNQDAIIEKIKKLLRMKRGGTIAEVETALNLARELAAKHGIDLAQVNPDEESAERRISHEDACQSGRLQWECKYAMLVCQQFFNITSLIRQIGYRQLAITFIGTAWDIQIALYVYRFLVGHFRREWNTRSRRYRNRQAFLYGMYHGLSAKLDEQRKATAADPNALVLVGRALAQRNDYIAKHFGKLEDQNCKPDGDAMAAKYAGYVAGRRTEIRQGINTNAQNQLLLT